jgi:hypothetical protein
MIPKMMAKMGPTKKMVSERTNDAMARPFVRGALAGV